MSRERDLAAELAAEIRAAVASTAPGPPELPPSRRATPQEETARSALQRALAYTTPTIPQAVRFAGAKRITLRLLRFLWRDQAAFNTLALEAGDALLAEVAGQRDLLERLREDVSGIVGRFEAFEKRVAAWERRATIDQARLAQLEGAGPAASGPAPTAASAAIPPGVYSLFEERFRGTPEEIAANQRTYLTLLEDIPGPVLDVGCGRGEFLRLLAQDKIPASGVDLNPIAVAEARGAGLSVEEADALAALRSRPAESLGAVAALQVLEHWEAGTIFAFLREARRVLAPGGILIAETINVDSLSAWKAFYLDPSHVRPVPPQALRFLAEAAGFSATRIEYRAPLPPEERLIETSENAVKLNRLLFGPQDYALIARVPRAVNGIED